MIEWIALAFAAPLLLAVSTHIDKYLVERFFKESDVAVLLLFTSLMSILPLPVIWLAEMNGIFLPLTSEGLIALSGVLYMLAIWGYLAALQMADASFIAPLFQTMPIFAYGLGYLILGETLTPVQFLGGGLIIASALVLTVEPRATRARSFRMPVVLLMFGCTFTLALTSVIFKAFAVQAAFWPTTFWMLLGEVVFGIAILLFPKYRTEFTGLFRANPYAVAAINGANELINFGGGIAMRYALTLGPLSLVQAIGSTAPLFVFLIGVILTLFVPKFGSEDLSRGEVWRKAAAMILVIAGVILITRN